MFDVLIQMAALIACGVLWRAITPGGVSVDALRLALTSLVYYLLLPALVLLVLWQAPLGVESLKISVAAMVGILISLLLAWLCYRRFNDSAFIGAAIIAAGFPNATYLGLPVLEATFGEWARGTAIQYDLFASTPLLLTAGILIARYYRSDEQGGDENPLMALLKVPPIWAAMAAVVLNVAGVPMVSPVENFLDTLGNGVVTLMLISLGMSLRWDTLRLKRVPVMVPVLLIQLMVMPLVVWGMGSLLGFSGDHLTALVLEGAMPCMVLGMVICDRYGLDTAMFAAMVTLSTLLSMLTLPFWFMLLGV
ncbi:MAG: AEC family transporter [Gammaproteobacteria bacterium]|nr:AEC family transporter [Gammaproteobacteria bacterium]